jgi:hypothetical protein
MYKMQETMLTNQWTQPYRAKKQLVQTSVNQSRRASTFCYLVKARKLLSPTASLANGYQTMVVGEPIFVFSFCGACFLTMKKWEGKH